MNKNELKRDIRAKTSLKRNSSEVMFKTFSSGELLKRKWKTVPAAGPAKTSNVCHDLQNFDRSDVILCLTLT